METHKDSPNPNRVPRPTGTEYRFTIDAYTPATMPMARLAEYMGELAKMVGEPTAVHFDRLEPGSTILKYKVEREAVPKVRDRIEAVRSLDGPADALKAYRAVNRLLREDNGSGALKEKGAVVIRFPGVQEVQEKFPPIRQHGTVDGIVVGVVGSDQSVHVRLMVEGQLESGYWTNNRVIGKELARLFDEPVRLFGRGSWLRNAEGMWSLQGFKIEGFERLKAETLSEALADIRRIPLGLEPNAYAELELIRHGPPRQKNGGN